MIMATQLLIIPQGGNENGFTCTTVGKKTTCLPIKSHTNTMTTSIVFVVLFVAVVIVMAMITIKLSRR